LDILIEYFDMNEFGFKDVPIRGEFVFYALLLCDFLKFFEH